MSQFFASGGPKYQLTFSLGTLLRTLAQEVSLSESSEELFQSKKGGARIHRSFCWGGGGGGVDKN